jgi:hypothetical protein
MRVFKVISLIAVATSFTLLGSCGGGLGSLQGGGGLNSQCSADFGADQAAAKLEAFLLATSTFVGTAAEIEQNLINTCKDMGSTLGIPSGEMEPSGDTPAVRAACGAVASKIQSEMQDLRASASLQITVVAQPPVCEVSVNAMASCAAECEVNADPGSIEVECRGGEIRGGCTAECTGTCSVEASAACTGTCEGTCSAGCSGTCNGACDGTCSAQGANGQCAGRCNGECRGTCEGGCTGQCSGQCVARASGRCEGECRGGCSVEFEEPRCTGEVVPPSVSADCQAACDARLEAEASCRPGSLYVSIEGNVEGNERVQRLKQALEAGLPGILALAGQLERMARAGAEIGERIAELPDAVGTLGLQAAACATEAVAAIPRATASVSVSVEVSASVSGSAGAG